MPTLLTGYDAYIFDFDGTLSDSAEDIAISLRHALSVCNIKARPVSPLDIGPPVEFMFRELVPGASPETIARLVRSFREHYNASGTPYTRLFSGIPAVLEGLTARKVPLFVATNKSRLSVLPLLERLGVLSLFQDVLCCDSQLEATGVMLSKADMIQHIVAKYKLEPSRTVMIGDSLHDIEGGKAAGVHTAGVLYGYSPDGAIAAACPDHLVPSQDWRDELAK